jgi:AAA+ ATPase superfamily predicted ATPase
MFINRNNELLLLENDFEKPYASLNFIFGRRRVGKTFLVNEYMKNKNTLYLSSFEITKDLFFTNMKKIIDDFFHVNNNVIINTSFELFKYISDQKISNKLVLIIENIENIINIDKNFFSDFIFSWNKYLRHKNLQVILTSSTFSSLSMQSIPNVKVDNILNLKNYNFNELKQFFPKSDEETLRNIYSIFDTNIELLKYYDENLDFYENIETLFLKNNSPLFKFGIDLIKNELSDVSTYLSILYAISMGNNKIGDIASFINLKSTYITRYIQKLVDMMVLEKKIPINDSPNSSKFGRYEFTDTLVKFWFSYVYPNFNLISQNQTSLILNDIKENLSNTFLLDTRKKIMITDIKNNYHEIIGYKPIKIDSWWNNKDINIDLIAYDSKYITFIDCKNDENSDLVKLEQKLKIKSKSFKTTLTKKYMIY